MVWQKQFKSSLWRCRLNCWAVWLLFALMGCFVLGIVLFDYLEGFLHDWNPMFFIGIFFGIDWFLSLFFFFVMGNSSILLFLYLIWWVCALFQYYSWLCCWITWEGLQDLGKCYFPNLVGDACEVGVKFYTVWHVAP